MSSISIHGYSRGIYVHKCGSSLLQELGPWGIRVSLGEISYRPFHQTSRALRIAIDVSIWLFQAQAAQGGLNPELRALFYRLARLISLPVHPIFVFDGSGRPEYKRGKLVIRNGRAGAWNIRSSKRLIELFGFHHHDAPGEAEAECAKLQTMGIVDAAMSNDIDTVMFGSKITFMNFSRASKGPSAATHVSVYRRDGSATNVPFDVGGMVLFALLSGGDYLPAGVPRCGPKLAAEIARAGFGTDLLDIITSNPRDLTMPLNEWRKRLDYELSTNESGYFKSKHMAVRIPESFPDLQVLFDYIHPLTSSERDLEKLRKLQWNGDFDVSALRQFVSEELGWTSLAGAHRFVRKLAPALICYRLYAQPQAPPRAKVSGRKDNPTMDGLAEIKLQFVPAQVVGLNLELESESLSQTESADVTVDMVESDDEDDGIEMLHSTTKRVFYDPTKEQTLWVFEALVKLFGKSGRSTIERRNQTGEGRRDSMSNHTQRTIADCTAFAVRSTKRRNIPHSPGSRSLQGKLITQLPATSRQLWLSETVTKDDSNHSHSFRALDLLETEFQSITISSSSDEGSSRAERRGKASPVKGRSKATKSRETRNKLGPSKFNTTHLSPQASVSSSDTSLIKEALATPKHSAQPILKPPCEGKNLTSLDSLLVDDFQGLSIQDENSLQSTEAPSEQTTHIHLQDINIWNGFWTHTPGVRSKDTSLANYCDKAPTQSKSSKQKKHAGRISILDLT
ncbi:flap endonuclease [Coccidioides immitis H538.4]|uniref:Flap endonuclease n=1 Tax=Coccidioides immitis H538.4 TaxID=396776 RepID=A0A0J8RD19_COCIT|nr:flap endonuclease [Coccidioides immitis H538.4]